MRMRKKKNGKQRMEACAQYLLTDQNEISAVLQQKELYLEIGCGKGRFLCENAKRHPDIFFIGLERVFDVALLTAEKLCENTLDNVRIAVCDAQNLRTMFPEGRISRIYLNFSDPWPKAKHAKRRLTHRNFLEIYKSVLKENGEIFFKTDNRPLFDFSLDEFTSCGFVLRNLTNDLHNSEWEPDNIHTEYEDNFSAKGFPINRVEAVLRKE